MLDTIDVNRSRSDRCCRQRKIGRRVTAKVEGRPLQSRGGELCRRPVEEEQR